MVCVLHHLPPLGGETPSRSSVRATVLSVGRAEQEDGRARAGSASAGGGPIGVMMAGGEELEERVQLHELNAGRLEDLLPGDAAEGGVLVVEVRAVGVHDEELAAGRARRTAALGGGAPRAAPASG